MRTAALARALWSPALRVIALGDGPARAAALAPLDEFLRAPTPAAFLRAHRALSTCGAREETRRRFLACHQQATTEALSRLGATAAVAPAVQGALRGLCDPGVVDAKSAARVRALTALLGAERELESRAHAARQALMGRLRRDGAR